MPVQLEIPFKPTNQIWRTYRHFPYKAWHAVGELVDNSTQSFFDNSEELGAHFARTGSGLLVSITLDRSAGTLRVADNAMGMDLEEVKRAVQLGAPPPNTSGRSEFGMGMKTACSWLGNRWGVRTKRLGESSEYSFEIDIEAHASSHKEVLRVTQKNVEDLDAHYTVVSISELRGEVLQPRTIRRIRRHLGEMYRRDINSGLLTLLWDNELLESSPIEPLETTFSVVDDEGNSRTEHRVWKKEVDFEVAVDPVTKRRERVTGWIAIVKPPGGRSKAGFDLFRRGRIVIGRPTGYRPERIFGEARNDLINQRLYGELDLDNFPVNHLKDDFLWDTWGDEFEEKLEAETEEYRRKARETRKKGSVGAAVVQATNDDIAEALRTEDLAQRISLLEAVGPTPPPSPEMQAAEAETLRNQPIEPRVVDHMGKTYRIYHPQEMQQDQPYVRFEGPDAAHIDIFINDNHPHVAEIGGAEGAAERYQTHALQCVVDAIACHLISGLRRTVTPDVFLQYKDQLLRVLRHPD